MRVLVSAYACRPGRGSEPQVGWTWVRSIARCTSELHVLTRARHRSEIEAARRAELPGHVRFHYHDLPAWARFWKRGGHTTRLYYRLWQRSARDLVRRLHSEHRYDAVHHVTFTALYAPPAVAAVDAPLIWGPVGGVLTPRALRRGLGPRARLEAALHDRGLCAAMRAPAMRRALDRTRLLLKTPGTSPGLRAPGTRSMITGNMYLDPSVHPVARHAIAGRPGGRRRAAGALELIGAFRLVPFKGAPIGLRALAELARRGVDARWTILGDGPERRRWRSAARRLGVADRVRFAGRVPRDDALAAFARADALLHTGYRDGCASAVLEGMAAALPVVCLDWGGLRHLVDGASGFRVRPRGSVDGIAERLAGAIERLCDPRMRRQMGAAARQRVADRFSLAQLDRVVDRVYGAIEPGATT